MITRSRVAVLRPRPLDNEAGLIGWWPFDDGKATDFSGNQNNGVATGTPVFSGSEAGNSYGFTLGNYFRVTTLGASNPISTNAVTAAAWLKPNVLTRGDILTVWFGDGSGTDQFNLLYGLTSGKPQMFTNAGGVQTSGVGSTAMAVGIWYHVAGTFDGTNVAVYLNGKLEATAVHAGTMGSGASNPLAIGVSGTSFTNLLDGSLADARVYNRALSAQEINELYNKSVTRLANSPDEWEMAVLQAAAAAAAQPYAAFSIPQHDGQVYSQMIGY